MQVEIWSDVACPFCYLGKRNFETALADYAGAGEVQVIWRSFQLAPELPRTAEERGETGNMHRYLAELKGISYEDAVALNDRVVQMGAEAGLDYNFDIAIPANTFDAHRLLQSALETGRQNELKERLLRGYFSEGVDLLDHGALARIYEDAGLSRRDAERILAGDEFAAEVQRDRAEGAALGLRGVPFFVIDRAFGVSGAQPPEAFLHLLQTAAESRAA